MTGSLLLPGTQVGDYIVRDADGDGEITPDDRVTQGDYNPEFTYGFGINATYKGFDLTAQFDGIEGRKLYGQDPEKCGGRRGVCGPVTVLLRQLLPSCSQS